MNDDHEENQSIDVSDEHQQQPRQEQENGGEPFEEMEQENETMALQETNTAAVITSTQSSPPLPSEHSYLPGVSHPLYPIELIESRRMQRKRISTVPLRQWNQRPYRSPTTTTDDTCSQTSVSNSAMHTQTETTKNSTVFSSFSKQAQTKKLAVLELQHVVFFPGSTLPLRFRNPKWKDYLGQKIRMARDLKMWTSSSTAISHQYHHDNEEAIAGQITIGILTRKYDNHINNDDDDDDNIRNHNAKNKPIGRIGTLAIITSLQEYSNSSSGRRRRTSHSQNDEDTNDFVDAQHLEEEEEESYSNRNESLRNEDSLVVTAIGTGRFQILSKCNAKDSQTSNSSSHHPWDEIASSGDMAQISFYNVKILPENDPHPNQLPLSTRSLFPKHVPPYLSCQEKTFDSKHEIFMRGLAQMTPIPFHVWKMTWPHYLQYEISSLIYNQDIFIGLRSSVPPPSTFKTTSTNEATYTVNIEKDEKTHNQKMKNDPLSLSYYVSSNLPLSETQRMELLTVPCLSKRLRTILRIMKDMVGGTNTKMRPSATIITSPKNNNEETKNSEHQQYLSQHQEEEEEKEEVFNRPTKCIYCEHCGEEICFVKDTFTVDGAEGISGAYVNEYGIVHQTITVRNVKPENVFLMGNPETKDSWFPGYSWTIAYCNFCHNHLGWKFMLVLSTSPSDSHKEEMNDGHNHDDCGEQVSSPIKVFWGLSGASVTTEKKQQTTEQDIRRNLMMLLYRRSRGRMR